MDPALAKILWASFLGVAVGAAAGVLIAAMGKRREAGVRDAYLSSFRYILEGDPDAAIEALALAEGGGASTIATGVALGVMFRKKGDWSRAIRIHEALLRSPSLPAIWKKLVALELGLDFRGAGMVSQATEVFERLLAQDPGNREALLQLRQMSEESGDWAKALEIHAAWEGEAGASQTIRAHLLASLAQEHLEGGRLDEAAAALEAAREAAPACLHVRVAEAELAHALGEAQRVVAIASSIVDGKPGLLFHVLPLVQGVEADGGRRFLEERLLQAPGDRFLRLGLARVHRAQGRTLEAIAELKGLLGEDPGWAAAHQDLGRILLEVGGAEELRTHLGSILLESSRSRRPFSCKRCLVELTEYRFRCPRCFHWDSIDAQRGRDEEGAIPPPFVVSRPG